MVIEYTIHQYHKHDGDHNVSLSGDAAVSMARAMRQQDVFSLGCHKSLGITVTKIEQPKACKHCGSTSNNGPCWEHDPRYGHATGEVACHPCYNNLVLLRCIELGDTGIGIDSTGKPFTYDSEPLPLLNPGLV